MDSWLEQPGYPVLTAVVENDTLKISQKQFFIGEHEDQGRQWVVPLNSNWSGIPDTLETETLEIPGYAALAAANSKPCLLYTSPKKVYRLSLSIKSISLVFYLGVLGILLQRNSEPYQ